MRRKKSKSTIVAVSGGFDPIHVGHIRLLKEAKALGTKLVVILNNDHWLTKKKGYFYIPQDERKEIIEAITYVDEVMISNHSINPSDMSVCKELEKIHPDIFANGGDRVLENIPEVETCKKINCKMVFNVGHGGKIQSSSWLLEKYLSNKESR
jgi:D-beta-D-heptose 7-phosphate kinase/D-beta-D-heptose 1-phosphate adenosyltransferase